MTNSEGRGEKRPLSILSLKSHESSRPTEGEHESSTEQRILGAEIRTVDVRIQNSCANLFYFTVQCIHCPRKVTDKSIVESLL